MTLPPELVVRINGAAAGQELDPSSLKRSLDALIGDDQYIASRIWSGPASGYENLKLDIYVLSESRLYNLALFDNNVQTGAMLLDSLNGVKMTHLPDKLSPHSLIVRGVQEESRIFANSDDLEGLEAFQRSIIKQAQVARSRKG